MTALWPDAAGSSPLTDLLDVRTLLEDPHSSRLPSIGEVAADPLLAPIRAARLIDITEPRDVAGFVWPCDRRDTHGPHYVDEGQGDGETQVYEPGVFDCPGVKAHPGVMIGRPT